MAKGDTRYSEKVPGTTGNHYWTVRFDETDGFVGLVQDIGGGVIQRVLLSPEQFAALTAFVGAKKRKRSRAAP
jgi:hypothetical protein